MINLFCELSRLQAFGYAVGQLEKKIQYECKSEEEKNIYQRLRNEKEQAILTLQHEIIDMVNNLNGKKVY